MCVRSVCAYKISVVLCMSWIVLKYIIRYSQIRQIDRRVFKKLGYKDIHLNEALCGWNDVFSKPIAEFSVSVNVLMLALVLIRVFIIMYI
ncbi:hypothetical protein F4703DRAFT_1023007 [Phycomyces blakesleeanus]